MVEKIFDVEDLKKIQVLERECFGDIQYSNINKNYIIYVYREKNLIVGFVIFADFVDSIDLLRIGIKKEYRNNKIGEKLLGYALKELGKNVLLEVNEENMPAIKLYQKLNFKIINMRKNYYGNGKNAFVMIFKN